jgi:hypothetical protein
MSTAGDLVPYSKISCFFQRNFTDKALIPFIGVSALPLKVCHKKQEKFHPTLETIDGKEP